MSTARTKADACGYMHAQILPDRCIEAGDASIVLHNAGAVKAIREFFASDEVDMFFLAYSGHATTKGAWCFADCTISFDQVAAQPIAPPIQNPLQANPSHQQIV